MKTICACECTAKRLVSNGARKIQTNLVSRPWGNHDAPFDGAVPAQGALLLTQPEFPAGIRKDTWKPSPNCTATSLNKSARGWKTALRIQIRFSSRVSRTASTESGSSLPRWSRPAAARLGLHFLGPTGAAVGDGANGFFWVV